MKTDENQNAIFPKGEKLPSDYFTGTAWLNVLVPKDETGRYTIGNVDFTPGSRNNWHTHPAGQILLITQGNGIYQERDKPAKQLSTGDVVVIPAQVEHWHGATRKSHFTHITITNITEEGGVKWLSPVTEDEYQRCHVEL